jgi:hypothetical protein
MMVKILLLGLGLQSTALYYMSSKGQLPRVDYAIFSDLGKEGKATYQYLDFLLDWKAKHDGVPIVVCDSKNLFQDLTRPELAERFTSIPSFVKKEDGSVGILKRQCTSEYKIQVIDDYLRDSVYQLPKGARRPVTEMWLGITLDEIERLAIPQERWKINTYPFVGYQVNARGRVSKTAWTQAMNRADVESWYRRESLPLPPKSACVFCPYQSDQMWLWRKQNHPEDFAAAVQVDYAIRDSRIKGIHNQVFLHRSCQPLDEVAFGSQLDFWGDCSGICHV